MRCGVPDAIGMRSPTARGMHHIAIDAVAEGAPLAVLADATATALLADISPLAVRAEVTTTALGHVHPRSLTTRTFQIRQIQH